MDIKYFDHAATTPINKEVLDSMIPYFNKYYGNASSLYTFSRYSKEAIQNSREIVATVLNADSKEIYFTSGGSESDNLAIKGVMRVNRRKGMHLITSKIEHPAVLNTCKTLEKEGFEVTYLNVDENGIIDLKELENSIKENTVLVSIMFANNEIGTIEPIKEIGDICKKHNVLFHTDAVQAIGSIKIDVKKMNIDLLSLSAHKFYGPKGIGALYVKKDVSFDRLIDGGSQEKNKRSGTENVPLIVGLGKALEIAYNNIEENNKKLINLRDYYISEVEKQIPCVKLNGDRIKRLPNNANISFKYIEGESLLLNLDSVNICASTGSACSSTSLEPSHVLLAIGLPHEIAHGSLRVTFGIDNTKEEVDYLIKNLVKIVQKLRDISPLYKKIKGSE